MGTAGVSDNVAIVRSALESYNRRDVNEAGTYLHPDVEWEVSTYLIEPGRGVVRGREDFIEFGLMLFDTFAESSHEIKELRGHGDDRVVGVGKAIFRSKPGSPAVGVEWVRDFVLKDGKIWRSRIYPDLQAALDAGEKAESGR